MTLDQIRVVAVHTADQPGNLLPHEGGVDPAVEFSHRQGNLLAKLRQFLVFGIGKQGIHCRNVAEVRHFTHETEDLSEDVSAL